MGFINFVIAILCWSCCRFVETTCMFLYLTVVQRTGSELEVVWFLMSDCISNQPALTTDRNRSVSGQKQIKLLLLRQRSTLWLVLFISVGDTFLKLFIQVDLSRSSWQPYTYKKKNCAPRKKSLLRQSECSEFIFLFKEGYKVAHTSAPWLSSAWTANKRRMDPFFHDVVVALLIQGVNIVLSYFDYDNKLSMVALRHQTDCNLKNKKQKDTSNKSNAAKAHTSQW